MSTPDKDLTGRRFSRWKVLHAAEKPGYFTCQCSCGTVKDVYRSSLLQGTSTGCPHCAHQSAATRAANVKKSVQAQKAAADKYTGQVINGWRILEVLPPSGSDRRMRCKAICPKCGNPVCTAISRITAIDHIRHCAACNRTMGKAVHIIHEVAYQGGSSLASVKSRAKGATNRNSTTGINGVSRLQNGRYRAYIYFQRRQISLGLYDTLEEAADARKKSEAILYGEYLEKHEGWEQELRKKLADVKK